ncbi:hypothetical protein [Acinetobacter nectaris]|uniref:hypothetical protein n=1 Tax=Acinetobacter nectaris TaxID=1219382 RepID=UPI003B00F0C8|nr:DUF11 domain-containing protein [Acinetobacter nectaris]
MNIIKTFMRFHRQAIFLIQLVVAVFMIQKASFAASTQQIISNMAVGEYSEEGSTVVQVSRSNLVQTTVLPVYSVNLTANNTKNVLAGQKVYFNHTLSNTGNDTDQYNFTVSNNTDNNYNLNDFSVFLDQDHDGIPDGIPITSYSLSAGESVGLIVVATVPANATVGQKGALSLNISSSKQAIGTTNIDTSTVTNQSALLIRKKFSQSLVANGDIVTVRLDYQNLSNTATGTATLTDTLDPSLEYQSSNGENWNGLALSSSGGSNRAGINYRVNSNVVTAVLDRIAANSSGYIEFKVKVNKTSAGIVNNTLNVQYDHDNNSATANISDVSNTASLNIAPIYAVKMNGNSNDSGNSNSVTAQPITQGGVLSFTNYIWNTGNITDRFNLTVAQSNLPVGSQIDFYRIDGVTPLLDSNGDGIPDTGELLSGSYLPVIVKVRLPSDYTVTADSTFNINLQAQSLGDTTKKSIFTDQGTLRATTTSQLVDLVNSPENNGLGNGNVDNVGYAWKTLETTTSVDAVAGGQIVFPLTVKHTGIGTEYLLSANATNDFTHLALPIGIQAIHFYIAQNNGCDRLGAEIGKTRYLNDGESQLVCAVVTVNPSNQNNITTPVYFRVLSPSFVSGNNTSNPSQDILKNAITIRSLNAVSQVEMMPSSRGQVSPLGTVIYNHTLINNTDTDLKGNYSFILNDDQNTFKSTLFYDVNGNGVFDAGDIVVRSISDLPEGKLAAHQRINLLLQVKNVVGNNISQANSSMVKLTNLANNEILASITDVTVVNSIQLKLTKQQARDFDCNGSADEPYTTNSLTIGKQNNGEGQCVLYKINLTNTGSTNLEKPFTFRDMTPAYTVLFQQPSCIACSGTTAPVVGQSGAITGTLNRVVANQSYDLNFGVRYVGQ